MKVLLVSASPRVNTQITTAMPQTDVEFITVRTPQRALALLDEGAEFDIIVADADTHPAGGFFLTRDVKARSLMGMSVPPVLLLLARQQDTYLARWSEADAWILKPVDPFDLAEAVQALVERRPLPELPGLDSLERAGAIAGPGRGVALSEPERVPRSVGAGADGQDA